MLTGILEVTGTVAGTAVVTTAAVTGVFSLIDEQPWMTTLRQHQADLGGWWNRLRLRIGLRRSRGRHAARIAAAL